MNYIPKISAKFLTHFTLIPYNFIIFIKEKIRCRNSFIGEKWLDIFPELPIISYLTDINISNQNVTRERVCKCNEAVQTLRHILFDCKSLNLREFRTYNTTEEFFKWNGAAKYLIKATKVLRYDFIDRDWDGGGGVNL